MLSDGIPRTLEDILSKHAQRLDRLERRPSSISGGGTTPTVSTYAQPDAPTGTIGVGDLWIDTDDENKIYRWDGAVWVLVRDTGFTRVEIDTAANALVSRFDAIATSDNLATAWYQTAAPSGAAVGDLWVDSDDRKLYRWSGSAWVDQNDTTVGATLAASGMVPALGDSRIRAYYQFGTPIPEGVGDLWVDTDAANKIYRWTGTIWQGVDPSATWAAIEAATAAQNAASQAADDAAAALDAAGTDGIAPISSPTLTAIGGLGVVRLTWDPVANPDPCQFRVYASTVSGFVIDPSNLIINTASSSFSYRPVPLNYDAIYYFRLIQFDADGDAPTSPEVSAQMVQVNSPDISANYIYAGQVSVDQLTTGSLSADVTLSAIMRTGLTGARVEIGPFGIRTYDSAGTLATQLPSGADEANTFTGKIEATGLTVNGGLTIRLANNEIARDASVTLASGVTASQQAPAVVVDWESLALPSAIDGHGLVYKDSKWWTAEWQDGPSGHLDGKAYLVSHDPATGAEVDRIQLTGGVAGETYRPTGGLAWSGTFWYTLTYSDVTGQFSLIRWSPTGVYQNGSRYTPITAGGGMFWDQYSLGTMAITWRAATSQVIIAECNGPVKNFRLEFRNAVSCGLESTATTNAVNGFIGPVGGLACGNFDFGSERLIIAARNGAFAWVFTPGSPWLYQGPEAFPLPTSMINGFGWDGSNFTTARFWNDGTSRLYKHTAMTWTAAADGTWWAGFTWYDSGPPPVPPASTHETTMSPTAKFTMKKRARFGVVSPSIPLGGVDDPDSMRAYVGRGSSLPARTAMWLQGSGPQTQVFTTVVFAGSNPPPTNNFPTVASPGLLRNSDDTLRVSGDGSIKGTVVTATSSLSVGSTGSLVSAWRFGAANGTTDANSQIVVTHGLGTTPMAILLGQESHYVRIPARSSTTFVAEVRLPSTNALVPSTSVSFSWMALA